MEALEIGARRTPDSSDAPQGRWMDYPTGKERSLDTQSATGFTAGPKAGSAVGALLGSGSESATGSTGTPSHSLAAREPRTEVRPLDVDWSQIVRRCMDGDSGAWAEMVRTHHKRVYGLCYRFTGNPADAEDLTQDVFLKIYSNLSSFDTARGSLQVWITTMTRNLLVDNFRRTRNQRATGSLDDGWESAEELKPIDRLTTKSASPHELAAQKELAAMVQSALARVSVELREAVILRDLQDLDYKEIAQVLAIPEGTVKSRISRGRAELARLLERNKREVM
jgi:RNA polymerase sigma-70 factor (ECF subfamily)